MNFKIYKSRVLFDQYMTGLWEGDGHITRKHDCRPSFQITFIMKNQPLALKCAKILNGRGAITTLQYRYKKNACVLHIRGDEGIKVMIGLLYGNLHRNIHLFKLPLLIII